MKGISVLALLASCTLIISAFAGCNPEDKESEGTTKTSNSTTAAATTAPASETKTTTVSQTEPAKPVLKANTNAITFENGDFSFAKCMAQENFKNDESNCNLSVAEYNKSKMLKIEVLDKDEDGNYKVPKIVFDVDKLVGKGNVNKVSKITCDVFQVAVGKFKGDDGKEILCPGNLMGLFGGNSGSDGKKWITFGSEFKQDEWIWNWEYLKFEGKILLPLNKYVNGCEESTFVFMRWQIPNQADIYMDNITFWDESGKSIPLVK